MKGALDILRAVQVDGRVVLQMHHVVLIAGVALPINGEWPLAGNVFRRFHSVPTCVY